MSIDGEQPEALAVETVPDQETTAVPETVETPEAPDETRTFTQEELDAIVGKRLAREQRKWEREQRFAPRPEVPAEQPVREDFADDDSYTDAVADFKADKKLRVLEAQREHLTRLSAYEDRAEAAKAKYDDFEAVAYNQSLPVTDHMAATIQSSENGPEILYHLGQNPNEAARISRLQPLLQAREIGKLEATLAAAPPVKRTSTAPAPIDPLKPRSNGVTVHDTTDPRSIKSMSTSEWITAENARVRKNAEARH